MNEIAPDIATQMPAQRLGEAGQDLAHLARSESFSDGVVHCLGVAFALCAAPLLLWRAHSLPVTISLAVYCLGLLAMFGFSAAYNMTAPQHRLKSLLRRLDHAVIFIMIAGTYTPLAVNLLSPPWGLAILIAIWLAAFGGMGVKLLFPHRYEKLCIALYLLMGWMVIAVIVPLFHAMTTTGFWLLMAGSAVYSFGVVVFVCYRQPFLRAIWHGLVLVAAGLQFSSIWYTFAR